MNVQFLKSKQFLKDAAGWGFALWFIGYILGFIFFAIVSANTIGWAIMPIGMIITLWVLFNKIHIDSFFVLFIIGDCVGADRDCF